MSVSSDRPSTDNAEQQSPRSASPTPDWAQLALSKYAPKDSAIAVLLRLDKMRGTEWAEHTQAILRPMPDHKLIIGDRALQFTEYFDVLLISTSDPRSIAATSLACMSTLPAVGLRGLLSHLGAKVLWNQVRGGHLGTIIPARGDQRMYLQTGDHVLALSTRDMFGTAIAPLASAGDSTLPSWLGQLPELASATAVEDAPLAMVHIAKLPKRIAIPGGPTLWAPNALTMYVEATKLGLIVRGTGVFASESLAEQFYVSIQVQRSKAMTSMGRRLLLRQLNMYHLLAGLKVKRHDNTVTFSSSMSILDARALLNSMAEQSEKYFGAKR